MQGSKLGLEREVAWQGWAGRSVKKWREKLGAGSLLRGEEHWEGLGKGGRRKGRGMGVGQRVQLNHNGRLHHHTNTQGRAQPWAMLAAMKPRERLACLLQHEPRSRAVPCRAWCEAHGLGYPSRPGARLTGR